MEELQPLLEIQNDDAALLSDWYAVAHDLQHVINAAKLLIGLLEHPERDDTIVRSLWSSALISYVRCFGSGRRARLDVVIFDHLQGDPIGAHQYYVNTRNKHIAHPVNAFEEIRVGLLTDDSGAVVGMGHLATFRISDSSEGVTQLGALASEAMRHVLGVVQPLEVSITAAAKNNIELVASLRPIRIQPQGGGDAASTPRNNHA